MNEYMSIHEGDYKLTAYLPSTEADKNTGLVVAFLGDERVDEESWRLDFEPRWGLDVSDAAKLEEATEKLLARLPK